MYSFLPFYPIQGHTFCYFLNWHIVFTLFIIVIFYLYFFFSFPQLESSHSFSMVRYCFPLHMTTPFQATIPLLFINWGHPIFKQFFFFWIQSFRVFLIIHLNKSHFSYTHLMKVFALNIPTFNNIKHCWSYSSLINFVTIKKFLIKKIKCHPIHKMCT